MHVPVVAPVRLSGSYREFRGDIVAFIAITETTLKLSEAVPIHFFSSMKGVLATATRIRQRQSFKCN